MCYIKVIYAYHLGRVVFHLERVLNLTGFCADEIELAS